MNLIKKINVDISDIIRQIKKGPEDMWHQSVSRKRLASVYFRYGTGKIESFVLSCVFVYQIVVYYNCITSNKNKMCQAQAWKLAFIFGRNYAQVSYN